MSEIVTSERQGCCAVGLGGPWQIAASSSERGFRSPWHIVWAPKGYLPCKGAFVVALVAPPDGEDWEEYGLGRGKRPPMVEAICTAVETHMRASQ